MEFQDVHQNLREKYAMDIQKIERFREGGNVSYTIDCRESKIFLKVVRPPFVEGAIHSIQIQSYLLENDFPVIPIVPTRENAPYAWIGDKECLYVVYEFVEGTEPGPEDTEQAGELLGRMHSLMKDYPGYLPVRDKRFFIDRYIEILRKKQYGKADLFEAYGNEVWKRVEHLPRGYCHGDLYRGNVLKTNGGALYVIDFDTSCNAFPMYDSTLFCNDTDYFNFDESGFERSTERLQQFLKGYERHRALSQEEIGAFYDLIAVYHFQLQATILEVYGLDCVDEGFLDKQYDWLLRWKAQCHKMGKAL